MPEVATEAAAPDESLRSALAAAIASSEKEPELELEPAKPKPEPKAEAEPKEPKAEAAEEKPAEEEAKPEEEAEAEKPAEETAAEEAETKSEPKGIEPPTNWKAADKETFKTLPPNAQQIVVDIQKRMDADYTKKTQGIAALKSEYEPVDKMFEPYRDVMKQKGFTPRTLIEAWANVEKDLSSGEQGALRVITNLVSGYKVDPSKVALALGLKQQTTVPAAGDQTTETAAPQTPIQLPPELLQTINGLQQRVDTFEAERRATAARAAEERGQAVMNEIEKFKSAVDGKGTLLRPHFDEVEEQMTHLALAAKSAGQQVPPLQELYEKAVWANPSTRKALITAEQQQVEDKRKAEARAKAAAAKKAAASVTGAPGTGQMPQGRSTADKSLREQLEEAAEESLSAA